MPFSVKTALSLGMDLYEPTRIDLHGRCTFSPVASSRIILSVTCDAANPDDDDAASDADDDELEDDEAWGAVPSVLESEENCVLDRALQHTTG